MPRDGTVIMPIPNVWCLSVRRLKVFLKLLAVNRSQSILKLKSKGPLEKFGEKCYLSCIGFLHNIHTFKNQFECSTCEWIDLFQVWSHLCTLLEVFGINLAKKGTVRSKKYFKTCCFAIAVSRKRNIDLQILLIYNLLAEWCTLLLSLIKTLHDFNFGLVMEAAHAKHLVY